MRIFVTGATGYVGQALCRRLAREGEQVTALVRRAGSAASARLLGWGVRLVEGDLSDVDQLLGAEQQAVVHLAFSLFPASDRRTNVDGSLNLVRAAQKLALQRFVFTSSGLVYSPNASDETVDESAPCQPTLRFARQQLEVESALLSAVQKHRLPAVILRPSELWGGAGSVFGGTVELLRRGRLVLARRPQNLSMTELSDLVGVIVASLRTPLSPGTILNVASPCPVSTQDLYDGVADAMGVARARRLPLPAIYAAAIMAQAYGNLRGSSPGLNLEIARLAGLQAGPRSIDQARALLGFAPRVYDPVPEIIRSYAAAHKAVSNGPVQEAS